MLGHTNKTNGKKKSEDKDDDSDPDATFKPGNVRSFV